LGKKYEEIFQGTKFHFEVKFQLSAEIGDDRDSMIKEFMDKVNSLNDGEMMINSVEEEKLQSRIYDGSENNIRRFRLKIEAEFFVKSFDYDASMKGVIDEINKLDAEDVSITEIRGSLPVLAL
jgi:translation initiation factor 2 alpha subunit (eIF-2alpha)